MKKMNTYFKTAALCATLYFALSGTAWADTEPNNTLAEANIVALNATVNGTLGIPSGDNNDYYRVDLPSVGSVTVNANFDAGLVGRIYIYRPSGAQIAISSASTGAQSLTADCIGSDFVYVLINRSSGSGSYTASTSLAAAALAGDAEPNNSVSTFQATYTEGQSFTGHLGYNNNGTVDNADYFAYISPRNGSITFSVNGTPGLDYRVYLYRPNGAQLGISAISSGEISLTVNCTEAGTYVGLVFYSSGCGSYTAEFSTSTLPDANDMEPNNSIATAIDTYQENEEFTGQLGHANPSSGATDASDYFIYESPRNGSITFSAEGSPGLNYRLYLYRPNGTFLGISEIESGENSLTVNCTEAGTYVGLVLYSSGCGSYTAQFSTSTLPDANDMEPNNSIATAIDTYQEDEVFTGQLGHTNADSGVDGSDYFLYEHPRNGTVTFAAEGTEGLNYRLYLYRPNGTFLGLSNIGSGNVELTIDCLAPGTYVGLVFLSSGCGSYSASFTSGNLTYANDTEPNNVFAEAPFTWLTKHNDGQMGHSDPVTGSVDGSDYYAIKITEAPLTLSFPYEFKESLSARIYLYNQNGTALKIDPIVAPNTPSTFTHTFTSIGIHYVLIFRSSGCGSYRFGAPCESGLDVDKDNICDSDDTCLANGGIISITSGNPTNCSGDNFDDIIQVGVVGKYGQGTFGLATFPDLDVVALSSTGTFDMGLYPAGNYRIGHVSTDNIANLQGITNADQLAGCFDLANFIAVTNVTLVPGTITANGPTTVCGDDGIASNISFSVEGAEGPTFRWAVLDQTSSTVLANNTTGTFNFDTFGPGIYRVTRAVYSGLNPLTVDPKDLPACIRSSNLITVTVTSCGEPAALMSQPNPTTGISHVSFTLPATGQATLEVYDMSGRLVRSIFNATAEEGIEYRFEFDGSHLPNGLYLYRLTTAHEVKVAKWLLAR